MGVAIRFETFTLANGLRVVLHEDHAAPLVAVNLWYHVGSRNEVPGRTGFAHLFEHLLFQGSEHVLDDQHFELVQRHGGVANGSTWYDRTNYYETLPSHALELGLWLESDRMGFFESGISQEKLDNQRDVVKNERRTRVDNQPYGTWIERLTEAAYPDGFPYRWPVIGSMEDLDAATLEDVRGFFRTWYAPDNAVLTVAGDLDPALARDRIEAWFGPIPARREFPRFTATFEPRPGEIRFDVEDDVPLPRIFQLYHGDPVRGERFHAAELLATLLSTGRSSRLYRRLVYDLQLAKDVGCYVFPLEAVGQIHVQATCREGVEPARLEAALDVELARIAAEPPTDAELERAKNRIETDFSSQIDSVSGRADLLSSYMTYWDDPGRLNGEVARLRALSAEELREVAALRLRPENRVSATYLPRKRNGGDR